MHVIKKANKAIYPFIFDVKYGQMTSINCYLYDNGESLTLIDGGILRGPYIDFFEKQLAQYGFTYESIDQIILTHHHEDHIGIINTVLARKKVPIYAHHLAIERLQFDETYLANKLKFFVQLYNEYGCFEEASDRLQKLKKTLENSNAVKIQEEIIPLHTGDQVAGLTVFDVPGHSPDSILLLDAETKWAFSGDLVLKYGTSNALIDFDNNMTLLPTVFQQRESLKNFQQLDISLVLPGHNLPFEDYQEVAQFYIERIEKKCSRLVDAVQNGCDTAFKLAVALYGEKATTQFSLVMSEVIGYSLYAESQNLISRHSKDGQYYFYAN